MIKIFLPCRFDPTRNREERFIDGKILVLKGQAGAAASRSGVRV